MDEQKIWVTSDWHFGHQQSFLWEPRGYNSVEEMNEDIIRKHNEVVGENDIVYFLGDAMLNDNECGKRCIEQLNGNIHMIRGNHDTNARIEIYKDCKNVVAVGSYAEVIKYKKYHFYLSHYPTLTSNFDGDRSLKQRVINLCGHSHTDNKFLDMNKGLIYHCDMDAHNCYPVLLDDIIEDIKEVVNNA